jgi:hypothetical protein
MTDGHAGLGPMACTGTSRYRVQFPDVLFAQAPGSSAAAICTTSRISAAITSRFRRPAIHRRRHRTDPPRHQTRCRTATSKFLASISTRNHPDEVVASQYYFWMQVLYKGVLYRVPVDYTRRIGSGTSAEASLASQIVLFESGPRRCLVSAVAQAAVGVLKLQQRCSGRRGSI